MKQTPENQFERSDDAEWQRELAVNPFVLAEEKWRHENYHSKILAGLLRSEIGDRALLKSFLEYLSKAANPTLGAAIKKLRVTDAVSVETEAAADNDRRIDILIKDKGWAIIVENKIDGAPDEKRQIPDYLNFVRKGGVPVVAIVYLKAYLDNSGPTDRAGWTEKESKEIDAKLIPVAGVKTREDGWDRSLDGGWIHGTVEAHSELKLGCVDQTLAAYSGLLWAQAAEIWNDEQKTVEQRDS